MNNLRNNCHHSILAEIKNRYFNFLFRGGLRRKGIYQIKLLLITILLTVCNLIAHTQDISVSESRIGWLKKNVIQLNSIDPSNENFSDLAPFKKSLKNVRLVLLGEESHGDGSTFLAKSRLIKFLHQEMGFNVLVFESGVYDCYYAMQLFNAGTDIRTALRQAVYGMWSNSQEVRPLIDYIGLSHSAGQPLLVAGLDVLFWQDSIHLEMLVKELRQVIKSIDIKDLPENEISDFLAKVQPYVQQDRRKFGKPNDEEVKSFCSTAIELSRSIASSKILNHRDRAFWRCVLETLAFNQQWIRLDPKNIDWDLVQRRDMLMAENLLSLMRDQYPDQKFIVWAASLHNSRNLNEIEVPNDSVTQALYRHKKVMGDVLWKELQDNMYSLAFTAYEGEKGIQSHKPSKLEKPSSNSLEDLLAQTGINNAIVDFRKVKTSGRWLKEKISSRPLGYYEMNASWNLVFDGILFTRVMIPSTKAKE